MCQYKSEGGRRCAIHRHDSMVAITLCARDSGLDEKQVSDLFNELRREGRSKGKTLVDDSKWIPYLRLMKQRSFGTSAHVQENLRKAFSGEVEAPDEATFYALKNLRPRSIDRAEALQREVEKIAENTSQPVEMVKHRMKTAKESVSLSRDAEVPASYTQSAVLKAQDKNLPSDRATVAALAEASTVERTQERRVRLHEVDNEFVAKVGYDPRTGRLEVVTTSMPDTILAYRNVNHEQWQKFCDEEYSVFQVAMIAGNPEHIYPSAEDEAANAYVVRCSNCGQFSDEEHVCSRPARSKTVSAPPAAAGDHESPASPEDTSSAAKKDVSAGTKPSMVLPGVPSIDLGQSPEYVPSARNQCYPEQTEFLQTRDRMVTLAELGFRPDDTMQLVDRDSLLQAAQNFPNMDPDQRREIESVDQDTFFVLRNANAVDYRWRTDFLEDPDTVVASGAHLEVGRLDIAATFDDKVTKVVSLQDGSLNGEPGVHLRRNAEAQQITTTSYTEDEVRAHLTAVENRVEAGAADGSVAKLAVDPMWTNRYQVDGSDVNAARPNPLVRMASAKDVKEGLKSGKSIASPVSLQVNTGGGSYSLDDQGVVFPQVKSAEGYQSVVFEVQGTVGMRYNKKAKTVEIDKSITHLKCQCPDYRANYDCEHIDYARRHLPNVARQMMPMAARHPLLTVGMSKRNDITVRKNVDGSEYISLDTSSQGSMRGSMRERIGRSRNIRPVYHRNILASEGLDRAEFASKTPDEQREMIKQALRSDTGLAAISKVNQLEDPKMFHAALKRANTELPMLVSYDEDYATQRVTGSVIYARSADPAQLTVAESRLKCTCPDYAENYDCRHVRDAVSRANLVAPLPLARDSISLKDAVREADRGLPFGEHSWFDRQAALYTAMFEDPNSSEEDVAERLEAERLAELRREREWEIERVERERAALRRELKDRPRTRESELSGLSPKELLYRERVEESYELYRQALTDRWSSADPGYTNDPERFYADYQKAASTRKLDYSYGGVLDGATDGDGARRFGVEMEFVMPSTMKPAEKSAALKNIAKDLHAEGLTNRKTMGEYHDGASNGWEKWSFERDSTVDGEIVSPLLKDDEESWKQLETVCRIVKKHGGTVNSQAGSHVHVSTGSYGRSTAKHGELHRTVTQNEDLMYRLATNPAAGNHRGSEWCKPNIVDSEDDINPDHLGGSRLFTSQHENMLNMEASDGRDVEKSHVEFRMWDGSLNPAVIQRQVMFSVAMTDAAERTVVANGGSKKPSTAPKKYGEHKEDEARVLAEAGASEHTPETLMKVNERNAALLDRLFRRAEDRKKALELFARNPWQS